MAYGLYRVDLLTEGGNTEKCVQVVAFSANAAFVSFIRKHGLGEIEPCSVRHMGGDLYMANTKEGVSLRCQLVRSYAQ